MNNLVKESIYRYDHFEFDSVYRDVTNFVTREMSAFYLDFIKDVLYIEKKDDHSRRSIQTVLYDVTLTLLKLLSPLLPHTTYEVYSFLPHHKEENVYLENMPVAEELSALGLEEKWDKFMVVRDNVLKALEEARNNKVIGKSFNAKLTLYPENEVKDLLEEMNANLQQIFIVSQFEMKEGKGEYEFTNLSIDVEAAQGETCDRCWQVVDHTEEGLCPRCESVVESL